MSDNSPRAEAGQLDVAAILEGLRAEVRARRLALGQAEPGPLEHELQRSLDEIELHRVVSAHWPLIGRTLPQRIVALVNKLVRRYLRWYINPIVEQQNAYNDAVARTLRLLAEAYADLSEQIAENRSLNGGQRNGGRSGAASDQRPLRLRSGQATTDDLFDDAQGRRQPTTNDATQISIPYAQFSVHDTMALVQKQAMSEPSARFPDLELRALEPQLRLREQVGAHWPLPAATLPQRAIALVNKLVRRYLRWYINPIVEQQNAANAAIHAALLSLIRLDAEQRAQAAGLRAAKARGKR